MKWTNNVPVRDQVVYAGLEQSLRRIRTSFHRRGGQRGTAAARSSPRAMARAQANVPANTMTTLLPQHRGGRLRLRRTSAADGSRSQSHS
jgi:hypothetical protein